MSADLDTLLVQFLRERKYLRNLRPQTLEWYETAWKAFRKSATHCLTDPAALNRGHLEQFVYAVRDRGVRPVTCNTWLRALNAFCRWLHENGHAPTRVHTVFAINHRAAPRFHYPDPVEDAQRAVRYIRHHATSYGVDAKRIGAWGHHRAGI